MQRGRVAAIVLASIFVVPAGQVFLSSANNFSGSPLLLQYAYAQPTIISQHSFDWTDPASGGKVTIVERVLQGCSDGHANELTFEYDVTNVNFNPSPGNGFSGFQIIFNGPILELHNQLNPAIGGPWEQNMFSGVFPPDGLQWDSSTGAGIMPGQTGAFSFCTLPRSDLIVNNPPANPSGMGPNGWGHTWNPGPPPFQVNIFNAPISIPGPIITVVGGEILPIDMTALFIAGAFGNMYWIIPMLAAIVGAVAFSSMKSKKAEK